MNHRGLEQRHGASRVDCCLVSQLVFAVCIIAFTLLTIRMALSVL